jgi:polysaccharide pyruvyl transferase WcaK-like protein
LDSSASVGRGPRIGLLTPYGGSNLGDAAIQEALIESLRERCPDVELHGLNLRPDVTEGLHGIPCHLITGLEVPFYSGDYFTARRLAAAPAATGEPAPSAGAATGPPPEPEAPGLRERLKTLPGVGPLLRRLVGTLRQVPNLWHEARELWRSWRLVRRLDLLAVAGGGQLDDEWGGPWGHPYALLRWSLLARAAGVPFVVLSVGSGTLRHARSRRFFARALRSAAYRSYRDAGTRDQLAFVPETQQDPIVPDLALALRARERCRPVEAAARAPLVGLSPIAFGHPTIWPTRDPAVHERYLEQLTAFAAGLLADGRRLMLYQSSGADRRIVAELVERLRKGAGDAAHGLVTPEIDTVDDLLSHLAVVDTVVTSRLHGVILAHVLHRPCVAISFDRKVDAHMEDMGQSRFRLDIRRFDARELSETFARLEGERVEVEGELAERVAAVRGALDDQLARVVSPLVGGGR